MTNFGAYLLCERAARWPDRIAARCQGRSLLYGELAELSFSMGGLMLSRGILPGQSVLMALPDSFSLMAGFLGCFLAGIVAAPVNSRLPREDYEACLAEIRPALVIAPEGHPALEAARDAGVQILALDDAGLSETLRGVVHGELHTPQLDDVCLLLVTSGTTGNPKAVPHTHAHCHALAKHIGDFLGMEQDDVVLCSAKLSHAYGMFMTMLLPLQAGATAVLDPDKPTAVNTLDLLTKERVTVFGSVPALYGLVLLALTGESRLEHLRICISAGEALPEAIHLAWRQATGREVWLGYGSTETMTFVIGSRPPDVTPGTAGRCITSYGAVVLDEGGRPAPSGTPGHLAVRGPTVMAAYLNRPEWTARAFTPDGMLLTGDMAVEHDGLFTILGRMNDMFKAGGFWVSPTRVENALLSHGAVAQCAVTGGMAWAFSLVRAHVVLKEGVEPCESLKGELRRHAAKGLPDYMVPSEIVFLDALPVTPSGKIQRYKLRADP